MNNLGYKAPQEHLTTTDWSFVAPAGASGTFYIGGFYQLGTTSYTPAGGTALGTANSAHGVHTFVVLGASSTDMVVRITGTSITEGGVRTPSDTEDIDTSGGVLNDFFETTKEWIGQVSISLQSGTGVAINDGLCGCWHNRSRNFRLLGVEVKGLAGASDSAPNFEIIKHGPTGWTFNSGAPATPPTPLVDMQTDYNTEYQLIGGENFSWHRVGLNEVVYGGVGEGLICRITTTANKAVEILNLAFLTTV